MNAPTPSAADSHSHRQFIGLRREPGRLALAVFRLPLHAYRHNAGWLLGRTFLAFVHLGRRTGQPHETVAMVLRYSAGTEEAVICAAWGPGTDWVRNLRAGPAAQVKLGRKSFTPAQRFLSDTEALEVVGEFCHSHPWRLRLVSAVLGLGDLRNAATARAFVTTHPFVAFRPAP